jgi:hypothetical protein
VTVTPTGITISQRLDGDYAPNDFTDGGIGGTLLATLTFEGGEGVDSISKVSVYASAKFATSTIGVFAGLETIIVDGDTFIRSDSNCDGKLDISDAINTLNVLFLGTGSICCEAASDAQQRWEDRPERRSVLAQLPLPGWDRPASALPGLRRLGLPRQRQLPVT